MELKKLINETTIFYLKKDHKRKILNDLIQKAAKLGFIKDIPSFTFAIEKRETEVSTGIGYGIAIPHAKISSVENFFVLTAIIDNPVDWDSMDQKPVSIVFLIGGPADNQKDYLKLLSQIMVTVKNTDKRNAILSSQNSKDIALLFSE